MKKMFKLALLGVSLSILASLSAATTPIKKNMDKAEQERLQVAPPTPPYFINLQDILL